LCGKLHIDLFNVDRLMQEGVKFSIVLTQSSKSFFMKSNTSAKVEKYNIELVETFLKIRKCQITPSIREYIQSQLNSGQNVSYPIKRVVVKAISHAASGNSATLSSFHCGFLPTRVVVGFVEPNAYHGTFNKNPFHFKNFGIEEMSLRVGHRLYPYSTPLKLAFDQDDFYEGYNTIISNIRNPNGLNQNQYKYGYTFFAFDLTPDLSSIDHYSKRTESVLDLLMRYNGQDFVAIFYMEFDSLIEIDKCGQTLKLGQD
jgi:ribonucleoside-diphosphate reductase beta chain